MLTFPASVQCAYHNISLGSEDHGSAVEDYVHEGHHHADAPTPATADSALHDGHSEVEAQARIRCAAPLENVVARLDVARLLPDVTEIDLQVLTPSSQFGARVPAAGYNVRF